MWTRSIVIGVAATVVLAALPATALAVAGGGGTAGDTADNGVPGAEFSSPSASIGGGDVGVGTGGQGIGIGGSVGTDGAAGIGGGGGTASPGGGGGAGGPAVSAPEPLLWSISALALAVAAGLRRRRS